MRREVEVYLGDFDLERVLAWVRAVTGPLTGPDEAGAALVYHTAAGVVVLTPGVEDVFLGVRFEAASLPWRTDVECARAAAAALGGRVRCDPGLDLPGVHPLSDVFLEIADGQESLVTW